MNNENDGWDFTLRLFRHSKHFTLKPFYTFTLVPVPLRPPASIARLPSVDDSSAFDSMARAHRAEGPAWISYVAAGHTQVVGWLLFLWLRQPAVRHRLQPPLPTYSVQDSSPG